VSSLRKPVVTGVIDPTENPIRELVDALQEALEATKGVDIVRIDVRGKTSLTDYLLIASGNSVRHLVALKDAVLERAKSRRVRPIGIEGEDSDWLLVDFADCVVHLMRPETRAFYDLERLWSVGPEIESP